MLFDDLKDKKLLKDIFTYNINLIIVFCSIFTLYIIGGIILYHMNRNFIDHATLALVLFLLVVIAAIWVQKFKSHNRFFYEGLFIAYYLVTIICIFLFSYGPYRALAFVYFGILTLLIFSMILYLPTIINVGLVGAITICGMMALTNLQAPKVLIASMFLVSFATLLGNFRIMKMFLKIRDYRNHIILQESIIQSMSDKDLLTGLHNNKYINKQLAFEIERTKRYHTPLCMMVIDIDNFKKINEEHGQVVGDETLSQISNMLLSISRSTDLVGRFAGAEFIVVLPNTSIDESVILAERIRITIFKNDFDFEHKVSVSIGISDYRSHSLEEFIQETKNNVAIAKSEGRNKVSIGG